jgi:hypothetical protein
MCLKCHLCKRVFNKSFYEFFYKFDYNKDFWSFTLHILSGKMALHDYHASCFCVCLPILLSALKILMDFHEIYENFISVEATLNSQF